MNSWCKIFDRTYPTSSYLWSCDFLAADNWNFSIEWANFQFILMCSKVFALFRSDADSFRVKKFRSTLVVHLQLERTHKNNKTEQAGCRRQFRHSHTSDPTSRIFLLQLTIVCDAQTKTTQSRKTSFHWENKILPACFMRSTLALSTTLLWRRCAHGYFIWILGNWN